MPTLIERLLRREAPPTETSAPPTEVPPEVLNWYARLPDEQREAFRSEAQAEVGTPPPPVETQTPPTEAETPPLPETHAPVAEVVQEPVIQETPGEQPRNPDNGQYVPREPSARPANVHQPRAESALHAYARGMGAYRLGTELSDAQWDNLIAQADREGWMQWRDA